MDVSFELINGLSLKALLLVVVVLPILLYSILEANRVAQKLNLPHGLFTSSMNAELTEDSLCCVI